VKLLFKVGKKEEKILSEEEQFIKEMQEQQEQDKPTFKDLLAIMIAQYIIILPMLIIAIIIFTLIMLFITRVWLR
jgi:ABC-type multidrug transport system permease subunit